MIMKYLVAMANKIPDPVHVVSKWRIFALNMRKKGEYVLRRFDKRQRATERTAATSRRVRGI